MTLWGGRFTGKMDPKAWILNASLSIDQRLAMQDVRGSLAWASALKTAGVLSEEDGRQIREGLLTILTEFETDSFVFQESDEDIHTAVERRLVELAGPVGSKLHTGRSRNDQVVTDLRLWLLDQYPILQAAIHQLQAGLVQRATEDLGLLMPGYTHMQRAQPILLSHWWLSHFWPLERDVRRFRNWRALASHLPLGSSALAGTPFPVDRHQLAQELEFDALTENSVDAVSDRDFVAEFLFCAALCGTHLSRLGEAMVLFSSAEFGFFELSDAYATGSSLMPQKKNPDVFELARGKAGTLVGYLAGLMTTLKGLPSTYDKDLQEDKQPVFSAFDQLAALLPVIAGALQTLVVYPERMSAALDPAMLATDLADYLVRRGVPFRDAHSLTGQAVRLAQQGSKALNQLSLEEFQSIHPAFELDVYDVFNPTQSIARRVAFGGTALPAVSHQLELAQAALAKLIV